MLVVGAVVPLPLVEEQSGEVGSALRSLIARCTNAAPRDHEGGRWGLPFLHAAAREGRQSNFLIRPHLVGLHFASEAIFFSSTNSFIGGTEAVLVNRLAKWLPCESMFLEAWRRSREKPLFFGSIPP